MRRYTSKYTALLSVGAIIAAIAAAAPAKTSIVVVDSDLSGRMTLVQQGQQENNSSQDVEKWLRRLTKRNTPGPFEKNNDAVRHAFDPAVKQPAKSTARIYCEDKQAALGAIVRADGFILTKASELKGKIECLLADGRRFEAKIVGVHDDFDLAMLKIAAADLPVVTWRQGEQSPVGSLVAVSSADGSPSTIGVLSVQPREIAKRPGFLGVRLADEETGPRVENVIKDSPAEKAGLQIDDIISAVDDKQVSSRAELITAIQGYSPGDSVRLKIDRDAGSIEIKATLGDLSQLQAAFRGFNQNKLGGKLSKRRAGFALVLQHDAALRPNECGGPLVNLSGEVIGINVARAGRVSSFAVPASAITPLLNDFVAGKFLPAGENAEILTGVGSEE